MAERDAPSEAIAIVRRVLEGFEVLGQSRVVAAAPGGNGNAMVAAAASAALAPSSRPSLPPPRGATVGDEIHKLNEQLQTIAVGLGDDAAAGKAVGTLLTRRALEGGATLFAAARHQLVLEQVSQKKQATPAASEREREIIVRPGTILSRNSRVCRATCVSRDERVAMRSGAWSAAARRHAPSSISRVAHLFAPRNA